MVDISPIMTLFREFEVKYRQAGDMSFKEEIAAGLLDECIRLEKQIMASPATSAQDFAAKLIVQTRYGDFLLDDPGEGGLIGEALAILAIREHPDAKLIELGRRFEAAKSQARKLDPDRTSVFMKYEAERTAAGIPDAPIDRSPEQCALERKIYRESGYSAASDAFKKAHGECIRLMKAIHRTRATTLEGFAVKVAAIAFDQADFELDDPVPTDVAERQLYRLARDIAKVAKHNSRKAVRP